MDQPPAWGSLCFHTLTNYKAKKSYKVNTSPLLNSRQLTGRAFSKARTTIRVTCSVCELFEPQLEQSAVCVSYKENTPPKSNNLLDQDKGGIAITSSTCETLIGAEQAEVAYVQEIPDSNITNLSMR